MSITTQTPANAASEKQGRFLLKLAGERVDLRLGENREERVAYMAKWLLTATKREASQAITWLTQQPLDHAPQTSTQLKEVAAALTPGVYNVDGHVYVVKSNREGTRLYAKHIVESPERLNANGDLVNIDFVYEAGAIFKIKPEHRLSFEDAKVLTIRYGRCIACGKKLSAGKSVEQGIGPVCRKKFA